MLHRHPKYGFLGIVVMEQTEVDKNDIKINLNHIHYGEELEFLGSHEVQHWTNCI